MDFKPIDGYLLAGVPDKAAAIAHLLRDRSDDPRTAPFYRAFEAVGGRAADEALIALRLVAAGHVLEDSAVARLRGVAALARAARANDPAAIAEAFAKAGAAVADLQATAGDPAALETAAREAYARVVA